MKRILIVSELFAPQNEIGALRATKIRKFLTRKGYFVDVITKSFSEKPDTCSECGQIWRVDSQSPQKREGVIWGNSNNHFIALRRAKRTFLSINRGKFYCDKVFEYLEEKGIKLSMYNTVITTFGPISSIFIGLNIKRKCPNVKWICDFRDPMVVDEVSGFFKPIMRLFQDRACRKADIITTVSSGYLKRICGKRFINKAVMIPNGFDDDDVKDYGAFFSDDKLHFTYVGSLYEGKRKITPLFRAIRELIDNGVIDKNKVSLDYAGRDSYWFLKQAMECNVDSLVTNHNSLSRNDCLSMQFSSNILILSTWNKKGEEGVFPGKFLEYMMIHKPIISITDGNLANSEVTEVMKEGHFGVAYESVNDNDDYKKLKNFVIGLYTEWDKTKKVSFYPNQMVLEQYNYKTIARKFEALINDCGE